MRGFGELEAAIMDRLWSRDEPATVREVLVSLRPDRELAYNTVLTVMDNLFQKGWLRRERAGRAHRYSPVTSREGYGAKLMQEALDVSGDPREVLLRLLGQMSASQTAALRAALNAAEPEDRS